MDVVFTLSSLLFEHDLVVVNGLGVFTTEIEKTYVHPVENSFSPEFKKIRFKYDENTKDDLLNREMAAKDAERIIESFVIKVKSELKEGKKVQLKNIGYLFAHHTGEILLEQDRSFNYVKKNFGLQGFIQEPVEKILPKEDPIIAVSASAEESKKRPLGWIFTIAAVLLIGVLVFWQWDYLKSFMSPKTIAQTTEVEQNPKQEATIQDEAVDNTEINTEPTEESEEAMSNDSLTQQDQTIAADEYDESEAIAVDTIIEIVPDEEEITQKEEEVIVESQGPIYYVIAGCFESKSKADRLLNDLQDLGFDQAEIKGKIGRLHRVCYTTFPTRKQASDYMLKLQREGRKGVWIQKGR